MKRGSILLCVAPKVRTRTNEWMCQGDKFQFNPRDGNWGGVGERADEGTRGGPNT